MNEDIPKLSPRTMNTIMGFIVRGDSLGITSFIRELNLDPKFYVTFLHFFRSSAWNLETLTKHWINLMFPTVLVYNRNYCANRSVVALHIERVLSRPGF